MPRELHGMVTPILRAMAELMRGGQQMAPVVVGAGGFNWPGVIDEQRDLVMEFLREEMERLTRGDRTVREADQALCPAGFTGSSPFLVVVCRGERPKGAVPRLLPGDFLYAVIVPDELFNGLAGRRLK